MKTRFYKHPVFIIFSLFIAGFLFIQQYVQQHISDEPVVLTKANPPQIIMYGTKTCMYCYIAKEFFRKHKLPFTEYDVEKSEKHLKEFHLLGGRGTPLIIVNKEIIYGYDEQQIRNAL
ncbi:hypothetical protein MNBD_GAMMA11-3416 [hydrothermal vent metagenome]|uniref:Glutaredoxin domain-containing protein n=1 Tax=hydrothermal vent metagenome TaxID=652676 RepID=A0A3B0XQB0_9ZZZZ